MRTALVAIVIFSLTTLVYADPAWKDLTPVTLKPATQHPPLVVAEGGKSGLSLCVMSPEFNAAVKELQACLTEASGATLPIVDGKVVLPAIVLGDCPEAKAAGLNAAALPPEGFEIKTAPEAVFIVGSAWGVYDFLERFVGVRWYWPADKGGRSILPVTKLVVPPVWLADAPVCRMRLEWPPFDRSPWFGHQELRPLQATLRAGRWPDMTVIYLPYLNYTDAPEGFKFPGNVEVELCGMPGLAQYKEPAIMAYEQRNIDGWMKISGRPIQNWHYSCWPADRVKAPYQYPHVIQHYYAAPFKDFAAEYAFVMEGQGLRPLVVQKTAEKPVLDGKLDDACWKLAPPATLRKFVGNAENACTYPTEVRALFTLDGVYFGLRMTEPLPQELKADLSARDDGLMWHQDCVELYLDVTGQNLGKFYQLIITARPAVMDMKDGDPAWNCAGLVTAVHRGTDFWSMEALVPFQSLGVTEPLGSGKKWCGQITRHRTTDRRTDKGEWENQKLNAHAGGFNANTADFTEFIFRE